MQEVSSLLIGVRDVGESIVSTSQDIRALLKAAEFKDDEITSSYKQQVHSANLVENILSMLLLFSNVEYKELDRYEEISNQVRRIEFSCLALRSVILDNVSSKSNNYFSRNMDIERLIIMINKAAYKLITLSFLAKQKGHDLTHEGSKIESLTKTNKKQEDELITTLSETTNVIDICYPSKEYCEQDCFGGTCYEEIPGTECVSDDEDVCYSSKGNCEDNCNGGTCYEASGTNAYNEHIEHIMNIDKCYSTEEMCMKECPYNECYESHYEFEQSEKCPEYSEHFTESTLTHVENGYLEDSKTVVITNSDTNNINADENITKEIDASNNNKQYPLKKYFIEVIMMTKTNNAHYSCNKTENETPYLNAGYSTVRSHESQSFDESTKIDISKTTSDYGEITTEHYESTTLDYEISTETYDFTTESVLVTEEAVTDYYEYTTQSYFTSEEPTTPSYETTTEDLYKVSQDIYAVAQDLSTKANEISSMSSDISSKVSDISSMVNDLNSYDDDELSKKVQSISKMTQEISSKTSEISSLSSTTSSLASDISSASSDMTSVDRNHPFRTTPWQKMSSKGQDMITCSQSIITAAQDILMKLESVVSATSDMVVAQRVASLGYDVTARIQKLIAESLNIMTGVIDLMHVVES